MPLHVPVALTALPMPNDAQFEKEKEKEIGKQITFKIQKAAIFGEAWERSKCAILASKET